MNAELGWVCAGFEPPGWYSTSTPFMLLPGTFGRARSNTSVTLAFSVVIRTVGKLMADAAPMESATKATPQRNLVNMGVLRPLIYICGYPPTPNLDHMSVTYMACSTALISSP